MINDDLWAEEVEEAQKPEASTNEQLNSIPANPTSQTQLTDAPVRSKKSGLGGYVGFLVTRFARKGSAETATPNSIYFW